MERIRRFFDGVVMGSGFGVTLLAITAMILVIGFFAQGIHLAGIDDKPRGESAAAASRRAPSRTHAIRSQDIVASDEPASSVGVTPSSRYATNRGAALRPASSGYVAQLIRTCDCRWADDADAPLEGTQLRVGHTLHVAGGLVEIAFACGAKAILQGPAVLELQSEKSGTLHAGRMTADVPDDVEGFTVHTPLAHLVSLGGVKVAPAAKLTATDDCRWAEGNAAIKEGVDLAPGQRLDLLEGLAEITFRCGAKVILQGPARFEIESPKTAILHAGKLTADVPDDLEGFKIRTPAAEVLSLPDDSKKADSNKTDGKNAAAEETDDDADVVVLSAGQTTEVVAPAKDSAAEKTPPAKP